MKTYSLRRRGHELGQVPAQPGAETGDSLSAWQAGTPVYLPACCRADLAGHQKNTQQSKRLYQAILNEQECDNLLGQPPYINRLSERFESLGSSYNEGDEQEIETVLFDAIEDGEVIAEDLWLKISWLSFYEEDASFRFRFSFGVDNVEDVAEDPKRQHYAALLTEAVFPESTLITKNSELYQTLCKLLNSESINFVERIIYFNSPDGGAYLHHDRERGHAGVVYAQVTGQTYWLALPKQMLMAEITDFVDQCQSENHWPDSITSSQQLELIDLASNTQTLSTELESFANDTLIQLINETKQFVQQLIIKGHGRVVQPGDVLLLPQETDLNCCWHSVFCLGEETGQALSFAVRV